MDVYFDSGPRLLDLVGMALGCALSCYRMLSGNLGAGSLVFNLVGNLSCEEKSLEAKS